MEYNAAAVRELLDVAFSDDGLSTFCFDHFREVYDQFAAGQTKGQRVRMLVEYVNRQRELDKLLAAVRKANPKAYAEYEPRLGGEGAAATLKAGPVPAAAQKVKVLFLAASPASMTALALDEEAREVEAKIRASEHHDTLDL